MASNRNLEGLYNLNNLMANRSLKNQVTDIWNGYSYTNVNLPLNDSIGTIYESICFCIDNSPFNFKKSKDFTISKFRAITDVNSLQLSVNDIEMLQFSERTVYNLVEQAENRIDFMIRTYVNRLKHSKYMDYRGVEDALLSTLGLYDMTTVFIDIYGDKFSKVVNKLRHMMRYRILNDIFAYIYYGCVNNDIPQKYHNYNIMEIDTLKRKCINVITRNRSLKKHIYKLPIGIVYDSRLRTFRSLLILCVITFKLHYGPYNDEDLSYVPLNWTKSGVIIRSKEDVENIMNDNMKGYDRYFVLANTGLIHLKFSEIMCNTVKYPIRTYCSIDLENKYIMYDDDFDGYVYSRTFKQYKMKMIT